MTLSILMVRIGPKAEGGGGVIKANSTVLIILKKFVENVRIITFLLNVFRYKSGAPLNIFVLKIQNQGIVISTF